MIRKIIGLISAIFIFVASILGYRTQKGASEYHKSIERVMESSIEFYEQAKNMLIQMHEEENYPLLELPFVEVKYSGLHAIFTFGFIDSMALFDSEIVGYDIGQYNLAEQNSNKSLILMMGSSIDAFFNELEPDPNSYSVETDIKGYADGHKVRPGSVYNGNLGEIINLEYYSFNTQSQKILSLKKGDKLINEHYALLRAYDVKLYLDSFDQLKGNEVNLYTRTFEHKGPKFRKVIVKMVIKDALKNDFEKMNRLQKKYYRMFYEELPLN